MKAALHVPLLALSACCLAQDPIKPNHVPDGKGAMDNANAIRLFREGKFIDALKAVDDASVKDLTNPTPWLNGALINLELGRLSQAKRSLSEAVLMGDRSNRRYTLAVELDTAVGQYPAAWRNVRAAEFQDPEDPYVHVARAKYAVATRQHGMAERSRWQAYRSGSIVLLDSKEFSTVGTSLSLGAVAAGHAGATLRHVDERTKLVAGVRAGTETIGGALDSSQQTLSADLAASTGAGIFSGELIQYRSDRPLNASPDAQLDLRYTTLGWQKRSGNWTINANFREAEGKIRPDSVTPSVRDIFQQQWMLDGRWDSGVWTAGAGLSEVKQAASPFPAVQPLEDILPDGSTRLAHGYLVRRDNAGKNIRLISGLVYTQVNSTPYLLGTAELAVKLIGQQYVRFGVKPTMNRAGTVLFPEDLRAKGLKSPGVDRPYSAGPGFNQGANQFSARGRGIDMYAEVPVVQTARLAVQVVAFQQQLNRALFPSSDPDLSARQSYTAVNNGSVTGLTSNVTWQATPTLEATLSTTVQSSSANYAIPSPESQLPNVPRIQTNFGLSTQLSETTIAANIYYTGERTQFRGNAGLKDPVLVGGAWNADLSVTRPISNGLLRLRASNLTRSPIYGGPGSTPSFVLSFESRF